MDTRQAMVSVGTMLAVERALRTYEIKWCQQRARKLHLIAEELCNGVEFTKPEQEFVRPAQIGGAATMARLLGDVGDTTVDHDFRAMLVEALNAMIDAWEALTGKEWPESRPAITGRSKR